VKQKELYDIEKLLCDIGGAGGLLLGIRLVEIISVWGNR